jgi:hypothetical protein
VCVEGGGLYSPQRESTRWGVRDLNMFDKYLWNPVGEQDKSVPGLNPG